MSLKIHFLYFSDNLGVVSEEQGERIHQDLKVIKKRYQYHFTEKVYKTVHRKNARSEVLNKREEENIC